VSADPRQEHWAELAYGAPDEQQRVVGEIDRMRNRCRELIAQVNPQMPPGMGVDWVAIEAEIRGLSGLVLEHVLPTGSPERLMYELHVMREFEAFAVRAVARAHELAVERAAAQAREALLHNVGVPIPGGLPGGPPAFGAVDPGAAGPRVVRERPSHFGGRS
jgi:hypothetical protein